MQTNYMYIKSAEDIIKDFYFDSTDEITLNALDSIISLEYEDKYPEIERCKIYTKLIDDDKLETYIIIHIKDIGTPLTFCVYSKFDELPKTENLNNKIGKKIKNG